MSAGAVFKLIANDGKADRMIVATKLLNQRIKEVMCARKRAGKADITPTLVDLERTHILFVNAHFKPFAAIGFEYNKVRTQSGTPSFGAGVTFSIPQFGDFFHDMVCRVRIDQAVANTGTLAALGNAAFGNVADTANDVVDAFGNVIIDGATWNPQALPAGTYRNFVRYCEYPGNALFDLVKFEVNGNPLDQYDEIVPVMLEKFTVTPNKRIGHDKLVGQQTVLEGLGPLNAIAVVDSDTGNTPANVISKNVAGQSNQSVCLFAGSAVNNGQNLVNTSVNNAGVSSVSATTLLNPDGGVNATNPIQNQFDVSQQVKQFVNGPQTPKPVQPILEIWNKLRFWFCDDVRLSIASVSIPFGQRFIQVELAAANQLLFEYPSMYLMTRAGTAITATGGQGGRGGGGGSGGAGASIKVAAGLITATAAGGAGNAGSAGGAGGAGGTPGGVPGTPDPVQPGVVTSGGAGGVGGAGAAGDLGTGTTLQDVTYTPLFLQNQIQSPNISLMELYINNIFVNPEIHDIYIKRIGFSLIRVFRQQRQVVNSTGSDEKLLSQLKWPIEYMWVGLRPTFNVALPTTNSYVQSYAAIGGNFNMWRDWHRMTRQVDATFGEFSLTVGRQDPGNYDTAGVQNSPTPNWYWLPVPTVNTLSLTSHGIVIYDNFADTFYNSYAPFHYGGAALVTPSDPGALFVNMSLYPRGYQPSGHLNISRARETYLGWNSTYISPTSPAELLVVAVAINFLLITDGSAVLRYST